MNIILKRADDIYSAVSEGDSVSLLWSFSPFNSLD